MRLLFVTASFEQSRDGVADYTALLAKECVRVGHSAKILAWNDSHINDNFQEEELQAQTNIPVLRFSTFLSPEERKRMAKGFINSFDPEVVSIQMVCFGFHPRGWIFGLEKNLKALLPNHAVVEIMFHELWLGLATNHPWKEKVYGWVQKMALSQFWTTLQPKIVHVGNNVYYSKLTQMGLAVHYLSLPSNITVKEKKEDQWIYSALSFEKNKREEVFVLLLFGSIHSGWEHREVFSYLLQIAGSKKLQIVSVGGQGNGAMLWDEIVSTWKERMSFVKLGFMSDSEISDLLLFANAGICTTPLSLFEKSGTAMAMLEHGLPVIVTRNELKFDFPIKEVAPPKPGVCMWSDISSLDNLQRQLVVSDKISQVASKFLKDVLPEKQPV